MVTGALNGAAVVLMYAALSTAPVPMVAPVVATHPLITTLVSTVALREGVFSIRKMFGAVITVAGVIYLTA